MAFLANRRSATLALATGANFGSVLVGLWAISRYTDGADQVALLNLWAAWGIALGLLGQVGLISGVLDRRNWASQRTMVIAGCAALVATAGLVPVRAQLFAGNESWVLFGGAMTGALYVLGRQRAGLSLRQRGVAAVVVTAVENVVRALLLTAVLISGQPGLGAFAIAAPLALSLVAFAFLSTGELKPVTASMSESRSVAVSVLAGVPAVLAYAVVPLLTLFGNADDLDQVAFAATLLRGPLIVAGFLAPWFLDRIPELDSTWRRRIVVAAAASVVAQVVFLLTVTASGPIVVVSSASLTALTAVAGYLLVVLTPDAVSTPAAAAVSSGALVVATATIFLLRNQPIEHSFLGVGLASLLIVVTVSATNSSPKSTVVPATSSDTAARSDAAARSDSVRVSGKEAA